MKPLAWKITITGTVQGVGFRPFVYVTAHTFGIKGFVCNTVKGVVIKAIGNPEDLERFVRAIETSAPPLSRIDQMHRESMDWEGDIPQGFTIEASKDGQSSRVTVPRDTTLCAACLEEMTDKTNRRFGHPFINCTQCGPRYSIIRKLPYDRPNTTMAGFDMCPACAGEYGSPLDRRFHAQPTCCNDCGPGISLAGPDGAPIESPDPIKSAALALKDNKIVAIKGVGGFHLACRADRSEVVNRLRKRKSRPAKPLALMASSLPVVKAFAHVSGLEESWLLSAERPIVVLRKKQTADGLLSRSITLKLDTVGVMLPSSPLHELLMGHLGTIPLVMTSGNITGEVLCCENDEAFALLGSVADLFLVHDRPIHMRIDDSVIRVIDHDFTMIRHARGYVPAPLPGGSRANGLMALGGIQKCSLAMGRGQNVFVSQYLGHADTLSTQDYARSTLNHLTSLLGFSPVAVAHDSHPQNPLLHLVKDWGVPLIPVQHHHAHAAACMGEHNIEGDAICVVYDGTGWGDDGTIWGSEIGVADYKRFQRMVHLVPMPMPGGDAATRYPGRMALSMLHAAMGRDALKALPWMEAQEKEAVLAMIEGKVNCPLSSGMGRLFDSAAALLGITSIRTYEGQPAIELEAFADPLEKGRYDIDVPLENLRGDINGAMILTHMWEDLQSGTPAPKVAARIHRTLAHITADVVQRISCETGLRTVVLSGGCFANALLFRETLDRLNALKLNTFFHRRLPPGDECVSYGQLLIAAHRM